MATKTLTPEERGKQFIAGILEKVAPENRAAVETALAANTDAIIFAGNGALRQDEFSRSKDAIDQEVAKLAQRKTELDNWFATNKPIVDRANEIIAAGGDGDDPPLDPGAGDRTMLDPVKLKAEIEARAQELVTQQVIQSERNAIPFVAEVTTLAMQHFQKFGELLDVQALTADPRVYDGKHGLRGTYNAIHGERWQAAETAARQKELDDAKALGAKEAEERLRGQFAANADPRNPLGQVQPTSPMGEALAAVQKVGEDGKTAPRDFRNRVDERAAAQEYSTLVAQGG